MQDDQFDDGYVPPTASRDMSEGFAEARLAEESISPEKKAHDLEVALATFGQEAKTNSITDKVFNPEHHFEVFDKEEDRAAIQAAIEADKKAKESLTAAANPDAGGAPLAPPPAPALSDASQASGAASTEIPAERPNSLEQQLNNIRYNGERQRRLVISGDPAIEKAFNQTMMARGLMHMHGSTPIMKCSNREALKVLSEVTKQFDNASVHHALSMEAQRDGGGIWGSISAGIKNNLGRTGMFQHQVDVVLVGTPAQRTEKMKELGAFVEGLEKKGFIPEKAAQVKDGMLVAKKEGDTVHLTANTKLAEVLSIARNKVEIYNAAKAVTDAALREHRSAKDQAQMAEDRKKTAAAADGNGSVPVNQHTARLAAELAQAIKSPGDLTTKNDNGTPGGILILRDARKRRDPDTAEIASLPDGVREKAVVQLAALLQKADDGLFDKLDKKFKKELDNRPDGEPSIRDKVNSFITMEASRDATLDAKAVPILKDMVDRNVLTEKQAADITARIAEAVTEAKKTATTAAPTVTESSGKEGVATNAAGTTASLAASTKVADVTSDARKEPSLAPLDVAQSSKSDTKSASTDTRIEPTLGSLDSTSSASSSTVQSGTSTSQSTATQDGTKASSADAVKDAAPAASEASQAAPQKAAEKAPDMRERIEGLIKGGPESLTSNQAHAFVAQMDAIRTKPVTALDSSSGTSPTKTLVRADAILKELETGRLGDELKSQAKDLREPLDKWIRQDSARYAYDKEVNLVPRANVVSDAQRQDASWHKASTTTEAGRTETNVSSKSESASHTSEGASVSTSRASDTAGQAISGVNTSGSSVSSKSESASHTSEGASVSTSRAADTAGQAISGVNTSGSSVSSKAESASHTSEGASVSTSRASDTAGQAISGVNTSGSSVSSKSESASHTSEGASMNTATSSATQSGTAVSAAQAAQRITETESAGGKLSMMMANPAGSFTNRDKSWNVEGVQRAASEVLRIDPESVSHLSGAQRSKLAAFSSWVAENARDGKLPGFTSESGKEQVNQLVDRAAALIGKMDSGSQLTPDLQKSLTKADNMVTAMGVQMQKSAASEMTGESQNRSGISPKAVAALSADLVHSVYKGADISEHLTKYHLKTATNFTPDAMKEMSPQSRAQTAVALSHLAQDVRSGSIGEFSKLPPAVQKQTMAAASVAENLLTKMGADPAMRAELNQAYSDLHAKNQGLSKSGASVSHNHDTSSSSSAGGGVSTSGGASKSSEASTKAETSTNKTDHSAATKSGGRSLDR